FALEGTCPSPTPYSFPTRRSSDLCPHLAAPADSRESNLVACDVPSRLEIVQRPPQILRPHDHVVAPEARRVGIVRHESVSALEGDRKSTRLNSSHQIISYALFCLK